MDVLAELSSVKASGPALREVQAPSGNDAPEFSLSEYYRERLREIARQGEMRAERFATGFRFGLYGLLELFAVLSYLGGRPQFEFITLSGAVGVLFLYNLIAFLVLRRPQGYYPFLKYFSTFLEIGVLTFIIGFLTYSQGNPTMPYTGAITLIYFIFIALASIRNDRNVIVFALVLTLVQYGFLCFYFLPEMNIIQARLAELTESIAPQLVPAGEKFTIVSIATMGVVLKLLYLLSTGALIVYALINSRRTSARQASLIFDTEKEAILKEKQKSDYLLLNILPEQIAAELKESGRADPRHFKEITVLFTDFKGFTQLAEQMTPEQLVHELDVCFRYFDDIMGKYGLEKIKTIGDAYMCAGGLPRKNVTHAVDCVLAALEIQAFMEEQKSAKEAAGQPYWELRLGIHTGNVVAGIVGKKKFAYDIWGDTVNLASRMESSGAPGRINISSSTYELVKEFFVCQYRGEIEAKNKGKVKMYFVHSIIGDLSVDGKGVLPNEYFLEKLSALRASTALQQRESA